MLVFAEGLSIIAEDFYIIDVEPIVSFLVRKLDDISSVAGDVFGDIDDEILGLFGGGADEIGRPMTNDGLTILNKLVEFSEHALSDGFLVCEEFVMKGISGVVHILGGEHASTGGENNLFHDLELEILVCLV